MNRYVKMITTVVVGLSGVARAEQMSYLDNGTIRIGVDLDRGGSITYFSEKNGPNTINSHDLGRQIQQSYYAGPQPFGKAHPGWKGWPWNPIGTGDVYGHPSKIVEHTNDGKSIHVTMIPMQWALDNVPGECTFETWISLEGRVAHVRCRLNNHRADTTQYPANDQELPAVYTVGTIYRLFTYDGGTPFTGGPLRQIHNAGPPWAGWTATEGWSALVNDENRGVGIIHPGVYRYTGGFHDKPGRGGPKDNSTGYMSPIRKEILDANIRYEYQYDLVLDTLESIRAYAVAHRIQDTRPDYHFDRDRRHWIYVNATDAGFPLDGGLRIKPGRNDPQMIGPEQWWSAESAPKLFIRAAFRTRQTRAEIYWSVPGKGFSTDRRVDFAIIADDKPHTYEIDLAASPIYRGTITGLRFDPVPEGGDGDEIRVESITWKPDPK